MREERRRRRDERDRCSALCSLEPAHRRHAHARSCEHEQDEETERDDAAVGELLDRHAVRLEHVPDVRPNALARDLERPRARTPRRVLVVDVHGLVPPAPAVVDVEGAEAARVVDDLGARRPGDLVVEPRDGVPDRDRESDDADGSPDTGGREEHATRPTPPLGLEPEAQAEHDQRDHERRADEHQHAEDPPVRHAVRLRRPLLHERRPGERPARDERRGRARRHEQQPALDALT